jgi:hypothetical protein
MELFIIFCLDSIMIATIYLTETSEIYKHNDPEKQEKIFLFYAFVLQWEITVYLKNSIIFTFRFLSTEC